MIVFCVAVVCKMPPGKDVSDVPPLMTMLGPPPIPPSTPSVEELVQQSQWNLQHQEQHLNSLRQVDLLSFLTSTVVFTRLLHELGLQVS